MGQRLVGGFSGALADELARQRLDPLNRQLAVGQQLEAMGTKPLAPAPLSPDASFSIPPEGEPFPAPPLAPPVGTVGRPTFAVENLPMSHQIAFAPMIAPLTARQASLADIEKSRVQTQQAQETIPLLRANVQETLAQGVERQTRTAAINRQEEANRLLRDWVSQQQQAGTTRAPGFATDLAVKVTELGAGDDAVKPLIAALGLADQSKYHEAQISLSRDRLAEDRRQHAATEARLNSQFKTSVEKGDVDSARNVVNSQLQGYGRTLSDYAKYDKELNDSIDANQKIVVDMLAKPEVKAEAAAKIKQARTEKQALTTQANVVRDQIKDAENRLQELFKETKSGAKVTSRVPTTPTPQSSGGPAGGTGGTGAPTTWEEYKRLRGG